MTLVDWPVRIVQWLAELLSNLVYVAASNLPITAALAVVFLIGVAFSEVPNYRDTRARRAAALAAQPHRTPGEPR